MKPNNQQLKLLHEQVIEGSSELIAQEEKFSKIAADIISKQLFTAVKGRIRNNGKIDFEYLSDLINKHFDEALDVFSDDVNFFVRRIVRTYIVADMYEQLVFIIMIDGKVNICFRPAKFTTTDRLNKDKLTIPIENKQEVEDQLKKTIEDVIVNRYNYFLNNPHSILHYEMKWVEWRKEQLKYKTINDKLPELQGLF